MSTFLEEIIAAKRERIAAAKRVANMPDLKSIAAENSNRPGRLSDALGKPGPAIIAEFKRASPSKGVINDRLDPAATAKAYEAGGAAAISVLTEEDFFAGSMADLIAIRDAVSIPVLRKDFTIDEFQIVESAAAGAAAILLIVAALKQEQLRDFLSVAKGFGLDTIVEVHDREEMEIAVDSGASIIGVNSRNLKTFEVSLDISRSLIELRPEGVLTITESGISKAEEIAELHALGFDAFLIGEMLMRSGDPRGELKRLLNTTETAGA
ncbi:MAG: indole-3-glycerol phosphate synthase TrpC [Acidobacteria bacterium]|nr:indole-3-glycerol phosphate synthase TrpC [Acidobacteriota bacterium]